MVAGKELYFMTPASVPWMIFSRSSMSIGFSTKGQSDQSAGTGCFPREEMRTVAACGLVSFRIRNCVSQKQSEVIKSIRKRSMRVFLASAIACPNVCAPMNS